MPVVSATAGLTQTADPLWLALAMAVTGQRTKSLRDSPLRGGMSRDSGVRGTRG